MNHYAIDLQIDGTENFIFTKIGVDAPRTSRAIKMAERLYPGRKLRVRIVPRPKENPARFVTADGASVA